MQSGIVRAVSRLLVVEDHPATRAGLVACLEAQPDLAVCGQTDSWREAMGLTRELQVLQLFANGLGKKEVAARLNLNPSTVGTYKARNFLSAILRPAVFKEWVFIFPSIFFMA